jgi:protein TonB
MTFTFSFENAEPLPMLNQNPPSAPLKSTQIATAKPSRKPALTTSAPIKEEPKLESEPEGVGEQPSPAPGLSSASGNSLITPTFEIEATQASESKRETTFAGLYLNDTPSSSVYSTAYQVSSGTVSLPFINASRQSHIGPPLEYPALALRRGYEGIVLIKIDVDRQGKVTHVQLLESSGYDILDQEVLKAAKKWLYKPAKKGNEPIEDSVKAIIRFLINEPIDVH